MDNIDTIVNANGILSAHQNLAAHRSGYFQFLLAALRPEAVTRN